VNAERRDEIEVDSEGMYVLHISDWKDTGRSCHPFFERNIALSTKASTQPRVYLCFANVSRSRA